MVVFAFALLGMIACATPTEDERARRNYEEAERLFALGDYERAAPLYEHVIRVRDRIVDAHHKLAYCRERLDRETEAIAVLEKLLRLIDPHDEAAMRSLIRLYLHRGYRDDAAAMIRRLLERKPADSIELRAELERLERGR